MAVGLILVTAVALGIATLRAASSQGERAAAFEGRATLRALCLGVAEHHQRTGEWLTAGPSPRTIPTEPVEFSVDEAFATLGFAPGRVRFQFEVISDDAGVRCVARGLDGIHELDPRDAGSR